MRICFVIGVAWPDFYFEIWDEPGYHQIFGISTIGLEKNIRRFGNFIFRKGRQK